MTTTEKGELIRLVRVTMGDNHPTGERIARYVRDGHPNLAIRALEESIEGLQTLIEMDRDEEDDMSDDVSDETKSEDQQDLDKYSMLLEAIKKGEC